MKIYRKNSDHPLMIKLIAEVIYSLPDVYGNRYYACTITDTLTGKSCSGTISGDESNVSHALRSQYEWEEFKTITTSMTKREFKRLTGHWDYMGCTPEDIIPFIESHLK